jgi:mycothiol system anti-sigma-R factor
MTCDEALKLVDGYLDGELDPLTNQAIEQHLRECQRCEEAYKARGSLIGVISSAAPYYKAPAGLRERIQSSLREGIGERPARKIAPDAEPLLATRQPASRTILSGISWNSLALAAAVILAAVIAFNLLSPSQRSGSDQFLAMQLIDSHVRSLMANHLTDVASSDQHTVKPWLDTKLAFAAPVVDLASEGFPLVGGRLDYLGNRPAAALVYQRRKHFINLFVWPAEPNASKATRTISRQGFQLLHWVDSDFNYWAVSDVSAGDLEALQQQFERQTSHR